MRFRPPCCPYPDCPSRHPNSPFLYHRKGFYPRLCDGRRVQRFLCRSCRRRFSSQSFRLDFRLRNLHTLSSILDSFVSKTTLRQTARNLRCTRRTVARRLELLAEHARAFHFFHLEHRRARAGGIRGVFQLDELETFETDRRLQPLTVPVLIERSSYFVLHLEADTLPARGSLKPRDRKRKELREKKFGKRRNRSRKVVEACFLSLRRYHVPSLPFRLETDRKTSYAALAQRVFGPRLAFHHRISSRARRSYGSILFPINHTLAMMRDGMSRLVRRSWGVSKRRGWLRRHLWIWAAWRNYLRGVTNRAKEMTPAVILGLAWRRYEKREFLRWRAPYFGLLGVGGVEQVLH